MVDAVAGGVVVVVVVVVAVCCFSFPPLLLPLPLPPPLLLPLLTLHPRIISKADIFSFICFTWSYSLMRVLMSGELSFILVNLFVAKCLRWSFILGSPEQSCKSSRDM